MDYRTCSSLAPAVSCPPCPHCGADAFTDADGSAVCTACTLFVPADPPATAALTRDQAFAKVEKLLWWHAHRYARAGRAGFGTTAEEFVSEATVQFLKGWNWFSGRREHLSAFATFAVKKAAQVLRRQNPGPVGPSLAALDAPDELFPDRPHHPGLEPDELDALKAALDALHPDRREEVERFYGVFGNRKHTHRELARRCGEDEKSRAVCTRVARSLDRLAERLTAAR